MLNRKEARPTGPCNVPAASYRHLTSDEPIRRLASSPCCPTRDDLGPTYHDQGRTRDRPRPTAVSNRPTRVRIGSDFRCTHGMANSIKRSLKLDPELARQLDILKGYFPMASSHAVHLLALRAGCWYLREHPDCAREFVLDKWVTLIPQDLSDEFYCESTRDADSVSDAAARSSELETEAEDESSLGVCAPACGKPKRRPSRPHEV